MNNITAYIVYLIVVLVITIFVGRDLHKNGYYLILDLFGNELFTKTINNILLTGYYLVNLGYVMLAISQFNEITNAEIFLSELALKIGTISLILGALHFNNIILLHILSSKKLQIFELFNT